MPKALNRRLLLSLSGGVTASPQILLFVRARTAVCRRRQVRPHLFGPASLSFRCHLETLWNLFLLVSLKQYAFHCRLRFYHRIWMEYETVCLLVRTENENTERKDGTVGPFSVGVVPPPH